MDSVIVRNEVKQKRRELSSHDKQSMDEAIYRNIITHPLIRNQKMIYAYFSLNGQGEVDTSSFIEYALNNGIGIALPKIIDGRIEFYEINSFNDLVVGTFGIHEPMAKCKRVYNDDAVILIPGLAFDYDGNRIGYGKGYYDRYLMNTKHKKIALAYNFQIYDKLEVKKHDVAVDSIVAENGIVCCHKRR